MLRILSQHAAQQVAHEVAHTLLAEQHRVTALVQLLADDLRLIDASKRRPAKGQSEHQDAERIDIVRDGAIAPATRPADRDIRRLGDSRLQRGGRRGPGTAERDRVAQAGAKHVVQPDAAMREAALRQLVEDARDRTEQKRQQFGLRPDAERGGQRWPRRGVANQESGLLAALRGGSAIGQRGQQPVDADAAEDLQGLVANRQMPPHLHCHQTGLAIPHVGDGEGRQPAAGAWQRTCDLDPKLPVDQGSGGRKGGRSRGGSARHGRRVSGKLVDK